MNILNRDISSTVKKFYAMFHYQTPPSTMIRMATTEIGSVTAVPIGNEAYKITFTGFANYIQGISITEFPVIFEKTQTFASFTPKCCDSLDFTKTSDSDLTIWNNKCQE